MTADPQTPHSHDRLAHALAPLGPGPAVRLAADLSRRGQGETVADLLEELTAASPKVHHETLSALLELERRIGLDEVVPWLDLAVAITLSSGATAIRYLRESPILLGLLAPEARRPVLSAAQETADLNVNVALEMVRNAPEFLRVAARAELAAWGGLGEELARVDYVVAVEFLRQSPAVLGLVPWHRLHSWVQLGMSLITQNSFGKPDYLPTLEFLRRSPAILGDIENEELRGTALDVGALLGRQSSHAAVAWIAEAPRLLRAMPDGDWPRRVLQYGGLVAERDAEAALAYFRRAPEVIQLLGGGATRETFDEWFKGAMEVLAYSVEGARAYFAAETRKALASIEQALNGVALRQVARQLKLFAQMLCGRDVMIQALPEANLSDTEPARASVSPDGRIIFLPSLMRRASSPEGNVRLYTVMTAHEAGHLECGTYALDFGGLADLIAGVRARYARTNDATIAALSDLFRLYPQPLLIRDLWILLEDARVESYLRREYPGLAADLAQLAKEAVKTRSVHHGMTARELVVDCLLLLTTTGVSDFIVPDVVREIAEQLWADCRPLLQPGASAAETVRTADRLYVRLEQWARKADGPAAQGQTEQPSAASPETPAAVERLSDQYRPVENWSHRGLMDAGHIVDQRVAGASASTRGDQEESAGLRAQSGGIGTKAGRRQAGQGMIQEQPGDLGESAPIPGSLVEQLLAIEDERVPLQADDATGEKVWTYDEWDGRILDYRSGWCRVRERLAADTAMDYAEEVLLRHGGAAVRTLRRSFERMKPPGLRTVHGARDGESLDWDAVVRRRADLAAGADPTDDVYLRREKRERDVAVAFLVDLSGSTGRRLEGEGRRVIDVEKEGLVLLCEAMDALGDQYAVYGYSGQGRAHVDFLVFKDFDEIGRGRATARLGAATPLRQNRDGAAIRHAARKLLGRRAKTKVLMLISDGRPLDDGYADEYSLEDTKMALREVRAKGIHPFCLTVDQGADAYVTRMYGEVHSLVVDDARELPARLPRVYQRLTA